MPAKKKVVKKAAARAALKRAARKYFAAQASPEVVPASYAPPPAIASPEPAPAVSPPSRWSSSLAFLGPQGAVAGTALDMAVKGAGFIKDALTARQFSLKVQRVPVGKRGKARLHITEMSLTPTAGGLLALAIGAYLMHGLPGLPLGLGKGNPILFPLHETTIAGKKVKIPQGASFIGLGIPGWAIDWAVQATGLDKAPKKA